MSKYVPVTTRQTDNLCKVANEKRIGKAVFQKAMDDGSFARYLDSLKQNGVALTEITPPEGCRSHILRVRVKQDREWQEAINLAGPNTPDNYNVRKVGDQYPAGKGETEEDLILLNYTQGDGSWDKALAWAKEKQLKTTTPRHAFAVGEQHPKLHTTLGVNPMYVVATEECTFEGGRSACNVWWYGAGRGADLFWVSDCGRSYDWFLFRK